MNKKIVLAGGFLGMLSVILGAFGAHGLKALVTIEALQTFETGVRYQMYHALFLLFVGGTSCLSDKVKMTIFYLVVFGILFFSGSIYGLATNALSGFDFKAIGWITPVGGLLLITAWLIMILSILFNKNLKLK